MSIINTNEVFEGIVENLQADAGFPQWLEAVEPVVEQGAELLLEHPIEDTYAFVVNSMHDYFDTSQSESLGLHGSFVFKHYEFITTGPPRRVKNENAAEHHWEASGYFNQQGIDSEGIAVLNLAQSTIEVRTAMAEALLDYQKETLDEGHRPLLTVIKPSEVGALRFEQQAVLQQLVQPETNEETQLIVQFEHADLDDIRGLFAALNVS